MDNRTPKNMQELLRFAIKEQKEGVAEYVQIDENKKQFLDHVLQSMSVNVIEEFLKSIRILQNKDSSKEDMLCALNLVREYIDNIDFANSFVAINGADILLNCVRNSNKSVCTNAIVIVAEMSQNNLLCQQYFLNYDIIEQLIKYLGSEESEIVASVLYALSAIIRNYEPALMEFLKRDGPKRLVNYCLKSESHRVFSKACFLITSISSAFGMIKDEFAKLGVLNKLIEKLRCSNGYEVEMEMMLAVILLLLESQYSNLTDDENKYIVETLTRIVQKNNNLLECEEIVSYSRSILLELESRENANSQNS